MENKKIERKSKFRCTVYTYVDTISNSNIEKGKKMMHLKNVPHIFGKNYFNIPDRYVDKVHEKKFYGIIFEATNYKETFDSEMEIINMFEIEDKEIV